VGVLQVGGDLALLSSSIFHIDVRGTQPGVTNGHDQFHVTSGGTIDLGNALLDVNLVAPFQSAVGNVYTVLRNDTQSAITTRFRRADGTVIGNGEVLEVVEADGDRLRFRVFYDGNDGNDVVLIHESTNPQFDNRSVTPSIVEGGFATLTGRMVEMDPLDFFILEVDWGDRTPVETYVFEPGDSPEINLRHRYLDNPSGSMSGRYTIRMIWRDDHGGGNSGNLSLLVANANPRVSSGGDATLRVGQALSRGGTFTDSSLRDVHTATVDYGDETGPQVLSLNADGTFTMDHTYLRAGMYLVAVTITDDDGGIGRSTFLVTVG
jgi:hypothetical protein